MGRDITKLHPFVQMLAIELEKRGQATGLNVKITDCYRTKQEQNSIDASRTGVKYPYSFHNWGLAFDVCQNDKKNPYPNDRIWWNNIGKIGKELGLEWGGDWGKPDLPHFQFPAFGTCQKLVKKYGNPDQFFRHADFKIIMPKLAITKASNRKKIMWLQVRLNVQGAELTIDGSYGKETEKAVKSFWKKKTGKECTGKIVKGAAIAML